MRKLYKIFLVCGVVTMVGCGSNSSADEGNTADIKQQEGKQQIEENQTQESIDENIVIVDDAVEELDTDSEDETINSEVKKTLDNEQNQEEENSDLTSEGAIVEETMNEGNMEDNESGEVSVEPESKELTSSFVEEEKVDFSALDVEGTDVVDIDKLAQIKTFTEIFYYNNYFSGAIKEYAIAIEKGSFMPNISNDTMLQFALSYVMQYENEELMFDYDTFRIQIPKSMPEVAIERFFYKKMEAIKPYPEKEIYLVEDEYTMDLIAKDWDYYLEPVKCTAHTGEGVTYYKATYNQMHTVSKSAVFSLEVCIMEINGNFYMLSYQELEQ